MLKCLFIFVSFSRVIIIILQYFCSPCLTVGTASGRTAQTSLPQSPLAALFRRWRGLALTTEKGTESRGWGEKEETTFGHTFITQKWKRKRNVLWKKMGRNAATKSQEKTRYLYYIDWVKQNCITKKRLKYNFH